MSVRLADRIVETVRYTYRLRPGKQAEAALEAEWHRCRWLWNEAVHQEKSGSKPTFCKLSKLLTAARASCEWLRAGSQTAQQQMLRTYARALNDSFTVKGRGKPTTKSRKNSRPSLEYTINGFAVRDGRLELAKCHPIPVVWSRALPSQPKTVNVYRDNLGHWYASFVVTRQTEGLPDVDTGIGIDFGVTTTAVTTDSAYDQPHRQRRRFVDCELGRAQRTMARRHRPARAQSKRYKKAKLAAGKIQKKAARQAKHDARLWARRVVNDHGLIAVEDFKPTFLTKSTMARKAADAAIAATKRTLIEYGRRAGRKVVLVRPMYTTMTCSKCFARNKRLSLKVRTFQCASCGYTADRDRNAARVILAVAERGHTCVDDLVSFPFET
ncbi:transposase [Mycobacterium sp.]|uniref:RNA-guided endonuclease InsQ/TnpB family protein n=1 Tax=Mycobacterium sp. TaxID=1785 RepID=UPI002CA2231D|nr:transposase [Mycobacterium sp.]HTY30798.1 transposase [Mycobacterium sp.]